MPDIVKLHGYDIRFWCWFCTNTLRWNPKLKINSIEQFQKSTNLPSCETFHRKCRELLFGRYTRILFRYRNLWNVEQCLVDSSKSTKLASFVVCPSEIPIDQNFLTLCHQMSYKKIVFDIVNTLRNILQFLKWHSPIRNKSHLDKVPQSSNSFAEWISSRLFRRKCSIFRSEKQRVNTQGTIWYSPSWALPHHWQWRRRNEGHDVFLLFQRRGTFRGCS